MTEPSHASKDTTTDDAARSRIAAVDLFLRRLDGGDDPLEQIIRFITLLRPRTLSDIPAAVSLWQEMLTLLRTHESFGNRLRDVYGRLFAEREQQRLYTEAGMLPNTGFFSELHRILVHRVLPEIPDRQNLRDCLHLIYPSPLDREWLEAIPLEDRVAFWRTLQGESGFGPDITRRIMKQLLDSTEILACRLTAMGLEPELQRVYPRLSGGESPFMALDIEVMTFVAAYRSHRSGPDDPPHTEEHLLVLLDQCRSVIQRAHQTAAKQGTSMPLTYLIVRLTQHLDRLELLVKLLATRFRPAAMDQLARQWTELLRAALEGELTRNSIGRHLSSLLTILSLRVTDNAGRAGEHYITHTGVELVAMWRAAAGAGFIIAFMALLKLLTTNPALPLFNQGLIYSLIYAGGFVLIHLCHMIVATKQPAMTASTIAATISQSRGRLKETEQLVTLIVDTFRTQIAAIAGNVAIALPMAVFVTMSAKMNFGARLVRTGKAVTLLTEIDPFASASLLYAAVAGFWLFMTGLVSGYTDNLASYASAGERIAAAGWLRRLTGPDRAARIGTYLDHHAGAIAGNIFFGFALGLTPTIGKAFGLPLDIRHITFSAANFGYAVTALDMHARSVETVQLLRSFSGVLLIGAVNLLVSFSLALTVALLSRKVQPRQALGLVPHLWNRIRKRPLTLFVPETG